MLSFEEVLDADAILYPWDLISDASKKPSDMEASHDFFANPLLDVTTAAPANRFSTTR
jgi:hypothetical protein